MNSWINISPAYSMFGFPTVVDFAILSGLYMLKRKAQ